MNYTHQPDDQNKVQRAYELIKDLADLNPDINANQWVSACMSCIADTFQVNGYSHEHYSEEMMNSTQYYKCFWEEAEDS